MRSKRLTALCLALLLMLGALGASAEALIPEAWEHLPVEVTLSLRESVHMPLDEERTEELNRLLAHIDLRLRREVREDGEWQQVAILVDAQPACTLTQLTDTGGSRFVLEGEGTSLGCSSASDSAMAELLGLGESTDSAVAGWTWSLSLTPGEDGQTAEGTADCTNAGSGQALRQGTFQIRAACVAPMDWALPAECVPIDGLTEAERNALRDTLLLTAARPIIRRLALLWPASESAYLNRDLDDWQSIMREAMRLSDWEE